MAFPIEYPRAEGVVYFLHIDFNLFIPSFFSAEPSSSSEEGAVPVVWESQINRADLQLHCNLPLKPGSITTVGV